MTIYLVTFYSDKMEPIINYLEDTEKKLAREMGELFSKMREQRDTMSLTGIEDMYNIEPVEGVLYDPCVGIPCAGLQGITYTYAYVKVPKDEIIIDIFRHEYAINNHPCYENRIYFFALTNYGRLIITNPVGHYRGPFESRTYNNSPTSLTVINNLELLPYKLPSWFYKIFKKLYGGLSGLLGGGGYTSSNSHNAFPSYETLNKLALDTTASLQELNKEFYLFAGKCKPQMTKYTTLDVDTMRQTIIKNTSDIQKLSEKNKALEEQNTRLQAELKKLKGDKDILEKERDTLLPLQQYKEAVREFMLYHYDSGSEEFRQKLFKNDNKLLDKNILEHFNSWRESIMTMPESEYDELMDLKSLKMLEVLKVSKISQV